jgi:hypothetical protein
MHSLITTYIHIALSATLDMVMDPQVYDCV